MKDVTSRSNPRAGDVLIARPGMPENSFSRTLVYLHTFSREGALGFILNRSMGQTLDKVAGESALPDLLHDLPLYFGGPVQADHFILALFRGDPDTHRFVCEMNPDPENFGEVLGAPGCVLRAFMGYSGWSPGQLEQEITRGDWDWTPPDDALLCETPGAEVWDLVISGDTRWRRLREWLPPDPGRN